MAQMHIGRTEEFDSAAMTRQVTWSNLNTVSRQIKSVRMPQGCTSSMYWEIDTCVLESSYSACQT